MVFHHSLFWKERPWKSTRDETKWPSAENNNKWAEVLCLKRMSDEKSSRRSQPQQRRESICNDSLAGKSPLSRGLPWEVLGKKRFHRKLTIQFRFWLVLQNTALFGCSFRWPHIFHCSLSWPMKACSSSNFLHDIRSHFLAKNWGVY